MTYTVIFIIFFKAKIRSKMAMLRELLKVPCKVNALRNIRTFSCGSQIKYQQLKDRTAIVTGSTSGLGFAIAQHLAREGAYVVISSRKQENVDSALAKLHEQGLKNVSGLVCDTTSKNDRAALIQHTVDKRSAIDIVVGNAGSIVYKPLLNTTEEEWDHIFNLNTKANFLLTKEVMPHLKTEGTGSVVYISSIFGFIPTLSSGVYNISKTALLQMAKLAAGQLGPSNIRVNCVAPGVMDTKLAKEVVENKDIRTYIENLSMMKRLGKTEEVAAVVAFLCSDDARYVTGETVVVAGGTHCRL